MNKSGAANGGSAEAVSSAKDGGGGAQRPSVAIRKAVADDVPLVLRLIRELAIYEKLIDEVVATEDALRRTLFPANGEPPAAHVLIGEVDGKPSGFALYFFNYSTFLAKPGLYLEDIFVVPESRRRGLGRALLLHVARLARDRGCGRVEWSVLDWNEPARKFYGSLGAVPQDEWTVFRLTGATLRDLGD